MPINSVAPFKVDPGLGGKENSLKNGLTNLDGGKSFKDTLGELANSQLLNGKEVNGKEALKTVASENNLVFSNHAIDRMRQRGISFSPDMMTKIDSAVSAAKLKGAKETLIITDESALIVSAKNNKVVTVMDKANLKENVFTNIDSTVLI
jgi:flagellar operon protein